MKKTTHLGCLWAGLLSLTCASSSVADVSLVLSAPPGAAATQEVRVWVVALNDGAAPVDFEFAPHLVTEVTARSWTAPASLRLQEATSPRVTLAPGAFARREYWGALPEPTHGPVEVAFGQSRVLLPAAVKGGVSEPMSAGPAAASAGAPVVMKPEPAPAETVHEDTSLLRFFKAHFEPHEPMYFIAGFEQPNAKFQLSLRYRIFNEDGWVPNHLPPLANLFVAYTQTSLWDWETESAPFRDSSYKPELHYAWRDLFRAGERQGGIRWDLEAGLQHESNGRGGIDSRSLNIAYLRPRFTLGQPGDFQVSIAPRVWAYVSEAEGRHTLANIPVGDPVERFRGYVDLRVTAGWRDYLMLSAYGRLGNEGDRGSLTVDASYPLKSLPFGLFAGYFQVQYFTGYGESLLDYDLRSEMIRFGFSMWR
jgi:outer membrane phospholipase A